MKINANIDTLVTNQFPSLAAQFLGAARPECVLPSMATTRRRSTSQRGTLAAASFGQTDPHDARASSALYAQPDGGEPCTRAQPRPLARPDGGPD